MKKSRRRSHRKSVSRPRTQSKGRKTGSHRGSGRRTSGRKSTRRRSGRRSVRRTSGRRTSGRRSGRRTSGRKSTRRRSGRRTSGRRSTRRKSGSRHRGTKSPPNGIITKAWIKKACPCRDGDNCIPCPGDLKKYKDGRKSSFEKRNRKYNADCSERRDLCNFAKKIRYKDQDWKYKAALIGCGKCEPSIDSADIGELEQIKKHFTQNFIGTESKADRKAACKTIDKRYQNYVANIYPESCGYLSNKASETQKATGPTERELSKMTNAQLQLNKEREAILDAERETTRQDNATKSAIEESNVTLEEAKKWQKKCKQKGGTWNVKYCIAMDNGNDDIFNECYQNRIDGNTDDNTCHSLEQLDQIIK